MSLFRQLTIHFETSAQLPPPYSYQYALTLTPVAELLQVDLKLTYTHRDELDADEIEAEGFTDNDDYHWKGELDKVWRGELEKLLAKTRLSGGIMLDDEQDFLTLEWQTEKLQRGQPENLSDWHYFAQELLQATFETSGKERAFELHILDVTAQGTVEAIVTASFRTRSAQIKRVVDGGKSSLRFYPWQELPHLMEVLYAPNWLTDNAAAQKPKRNGLYFNPGDELWYEYNKQVVEPGKGASTLPKLKNLIGKLLS